MWPAGRSLETRGIVEEEEEEEANYKFGIITYKVYKRACMANTPLYHTLLHSRCRRSINFVIKLNATKFSKYAEKDQKCNIIEIIVKYIDLVTNFVHG
jgi:hypothetical protein